MKNRSKSSAVRVSNIKRRLRIFDLPFCAFSGLNLRKTGYLARMGVRSILAKPLAAYVSAQTRKWSMQPAVYQQKIFEHLIREARDTQFGRDHDFARHPDLR